MDTHVVVAEEGLPWLLRVIRGNSVCWPRRERTVWCVCLHVCMRACACVWQKIRPG